MGRLTKPWTIRRLVVNTLRVGLLGVVILTLYAIQRPAYSRAPALPNRASAVSFSPLATPVRTPCPTPNSPPGDKVRIVGDDEILLAFRQANDQKAMANTIINNPVGSTNLEIAWPELWWTALPNLSNVSWVADTRADLNGDGKDEVVSAFRNSNNQLGALSWSNLVVNPNDWSNSTSPFVGSTVAYVDVAAGDLDRRQEGDEIVIAFRDNNSDIHVALLDGSTATPGEIGTADNTVMAQWTKSDL